MILKYSDFAPAEVEKFPHSSRHGKKTISNSAEQLAVKREIRSRQLVSDLLVWSGVDIIYTPQYASTRRKKYDRINKHFRRWFFT